MKHSYRSYKDEVDLGDDLNEVSLKTANDVRRPLCPLCPLCKTNTYVTPMQYGLPEMTEPVLIPIDQEPVEEFARVTYSCMVENYNWNCAKCYIRF